MKRLTVLVLLIFLVPQLAFADIGAKLFESGTTIKFKEDMHCLTNDEALYLSEIVETFEEECRIKLKTIDQLRIVEVQLLTETLNLQKEHFLILLETKDKTIENIYTSAITELESSDFSWWKVTLVVVSGVIVGAVSTAAIMHYTK